MCFEALLTCEFSKCEMPLTLSLIAHHSKCTFETHSRMEIVNRKYTLIRTKLLGMKTETVILKKVKTKTYLNY